MASDSFHAKGFDDATNAKLSILRGYLRSALPVFLTSLRIEIVEIYDVFSGPGCDGRGNPGSPLIVLEEIEAAIAEALKHERRLPRIRLFFNDSDLSHIEQLQDRIQHLEKSPAVEIVYTNKEFKTLFDDSITGWRNATRTARFVFMDQFGVKEVTADVFTDFVRLQFTDILFFLSSSFVLRFCSEPSFQKYHQIPKEALKSVGHRYIHRHIVKHYYKELIPVGIEYYLAPFTIKKNSNVYGLVFGSRHILGLQKFLEVCWKEDPISGEANFNINNNWTDKEGDMFASQFSRTNEMEDFCNELKRHLKLGNATNRSIYILALENGFIPRIAKDLLTDIQKEMDLEVVDTRTGKTRRKGAFYVTWEAYNKFETYSIRVRGDSHGPK